MTTAIMQAYRFELDPTPRQMRDLQRHAGAARLAFNWALALVKANISQREGERSYGLPEAELTPSLGWSLPELRRTWNKAKAVVAPWGSACSKESFNTGLDGVARALKNWADSKSGKRKGHQVGFPKFKARRRSTPSVRFTTGAIRVETDRKHVTLPRVGTLKTHESTRKLARRLEAGTARILSATVRREAGRWYCAFTVEVIRAVRTPLIPTGRVGVDLGISTLAVLSTGERVPNPRHLNKAMRTLRKAARTLSRRQGPDHRTGKRPSARWETARRDIARLHTRIANLRMDGLHKLTTNLASRYGTVVVEDLHVAGMLANSKLARHVADAGFGEIRRQLEYKTRWNGGRLDVADRWYPSSKTCSSCGVVKPKLRLSTRTFDCEHCGLGLDRDLNAARNLAALVAATSTGTGVAGDPQPKGSNGRGADQKTRPGRAGGRETSTPHHHGGQDGDRSPATASCELGLTPAHLLATVVVCLV